MVIWLSGVLFKINIFIQSTASLGQNLQEKFNFKVSYSKINLFVNFSYHEFVHARYA